MTPSGGSSNAENEGKKLNNEAKCILGFVYLEPMSPADFPKDLHPRSPQPFFIICFVIMADFLGCFTSKFTALPFPPSLEAGPM